MQKTILIIEDEKAIVDILSFNLEREGYRVCAAYDGEEGVAVATRENPDLILLDLMLPKMDGFEVCKYIRRSMNTPIIMLTAREEEVDKVLSEQGQPPLRREGYRGGSWVLLDFGCVIVHLFSEQARSFYNLEHLWADAADVTADVLQSV